MKLKLTHSEFLALYALMQEVNNNHPENMAQKLFLSILTGVYEQFYRKAIKKEKKYTVKLNTHEAIAFFLYFNNKPLGYTTYAGNLVKSICADIHKQYS